ncbi:hypothetical protein HMPREF1584_01454 [Gardnerella vaginalis JCP8481A]|nr:hypothetical protein HMPREF1584_01454 [Gardnerella vaginalis JCP8481A]EPI42570.1 hypothetical protein HMPREF1585_00808 [Gardnerella vaginalis JCP8481B]
MLNVAVADCFACLSFYKCIIETFRESMCGKPNYEFSGALNGAG